MNPIPGNLKTGTVGEILVQLRLLQYEIQAAPPLKDSGNDLIALKGEVIKALQIKTTDTDEFKLNNLPRLYHILALVKLEGEGNNLFLDCTQIFLLKKEEVTKTHYYVRELKEKILCEKRIKELFSK